MGENIDKRDEHELEEALMLAQHTVYKKYLQQLGQYPLMLPSQQLLDEDTEDCVRFFQLDELTCKKGEDIFQKLSTVYCASMSLDCSLVVMIDVEKINAPVKIYVGVRNNGIDEDARKRLSTSFRTLKNGFLSNFPGTRLHNIPAREEMPQIIEGIFGKDVRHISSVSCVAAIRDKGKTESKNFIQGLEHFIDAMRGNTYTAVLIAEPSRQIDEIRSGYEELYSVLSPFRKSVWSYNENDSESVMKSLSKGMTDSVAKGTSHTQSHTVSVGASIGINTGHSNSFAQSDANTHSDINGKIGGGLRGVSGAAGVATGAVAALGAAVAPIVIGVGVAAVTGAIGNMMQSSVTNSIVNTVGKTLGLSGSLNMGYARTTADTTSFTETHTTTETETEGTTTTKGEGRTLQIENVNKQIENMLMHIENQLKRVQEYGDYGAYNCGAYFLSGKQETCLLAANTYRALMLGDGSSVESDAVNAWNGNEEPEKVLAMKEYLKRFTHPIFALAVSEEIKSEEDLLLYSPGTIVSGLELPLHLGLPTKSVYGLPVLEHAEFGRNVVEKHTFLLENDRKIKVGNIYHMGQTEEESNVEINVSGLTAHTFVTGSTGSGKTNTIYQMIERLSGQNVNFLVVEPAKGEYKTVFGHREDVTVFGTNPKLADIEMLKINPFSFPENIHVLEHLDRLVEIFNVCWPMYAAMPAILKDAIQRSYEMAGWDMEISENKFDNHIFPTFTDVYHQIRKVLEESEYSQDNKGDYTGSLVTRLRSLTTGINGLIFTSDKISDATLFDKNVIIDLSRVGSTETKSLIMGLIVLKLQEYRMNIAEPNQQLRHITVLEEAHNLLRRTSVEQTSEGSNLLGKSVEMLANAIAEMRTYGEGFIIADQSPGLMDMSVIRNTNTKIIMRQPDYSDRELVGRAAGLNDEQIVELAALDNGVAAIRQSEWIEPVLCKVDKFQGKMQRESGRKTPAKKRTCAEAEHSLLECIMNNEIYRRGDRVDIEKLREQIIFSNLETVVKCEFLDYISTKDDKAVSKLRQLVFDFFHAEKAMEKSQKYSDFREWMNAVVENLQPDIRHTFSVF